MSTLSKVIVKHEVQQNYKHISLICAARIRLKKQINSGIQIFNNSIFQFTLESILRIKVTSANLALIICILSEIAHRY